MSLHRLLLRQLRRHGVNEQQQASIDGLLRAVSAAYAQSDEERDLLGRSLELTSSELVQRFEESQQRLRQLEASQQQLQHSLSLLHATLDSTSEGMLVFDQHGRLTQQNRQLREIFQRTEPLAEGIPGTRLLRTLSAMAREPRSLIGLVRTLTRPDAQRRSTQISLKDGRQLALFTQAQVLDGKPVGRVWCLRDVTEQHRQEAKIRHQAEHDALTGLPNRRLFQEQLDHALDRAETRQLTLAVLFIDLDHFKLINDSVGHQVGDQVLCSVANELQSMLRTHDLLARVGGDEFLLLLNELADGRQAMQIADRIVERLKQPIIINGRKLWIHASIGVALYPRDGLAPDELVSRADMAMYQAKTRGRNNAQQFAPFIERQMRRQLELHEQLQEAMLRGELSMVLQPKVRLRDQYMLSAEGLLRWTTASGETISPVDFIPAAERSGLIKPIGDWVLSQGLDWLCRPDVPAHTSIAINLSARQLEDDILVGRIEGWLAERGLPGHRLELEVTESMLMQNRDIAIECLRQLRLLGVRIAVDDFGTGYSSLNYLRWLPIDVLKIDRSFVQDVTAAADARAIVRSVIGLAGNLGLEVVAEGIEDQETADILLDLGCELGQGYLFGRPMPAGELAQARSATARPTQAAAAGGG